MHSPKGTKFDFLKDGNLVDLQRSVSGLHVLAVYLDVYVSFQVYIYVYTFQGVFSIGYYKMLSIVPCAVQKDLVSNLFYIQQCVSANPKMPIYHPLVSLLVIISLISVLVSLFLLGVWVPLSLFLDPTWVTSHDTCSSPTCFTQYGHLLARRHCCRGLFPPFLRLSNTPFPPHPCI